MAEDTIYDYVPHDRTKAMIDGVPHPVKVAEFLPRGSPSARFNAWFAVRVTRGVGTMWCAYVFAALGVDKPSSGNQFSQHGHAGFLDLPDIPSVGLAIRDHRGSKRVGSSFGQALRGDIQGCGRCAARGGQYPGSLGRAGPSASGLGREFGEGGGSRIVMMQRTRVDPRDIFRVPMFDLVESLVLDFSSGSVPNRARMTRYWMRGGHRARGCRFGRTRRTVG